MRYIIFIFLLLSINVQAQELTRITDFEKSLLHYDNQSFFGYEDNTYEYHISGRHVKVTELSNNIEIYNSRITMCEENFRQLFYYKGNMIFLGIEGLYLEGIFDGEDQYIDYGDFEIEGIPYQFELSKNILQIRQLDKEFAMDLDLFQEIEYRYYILITENSYFYKVNDQLIKENKITNDTIVLASNVATFNTSTSVHTLGDNLLINFVGQKSVLIDNQDSIISELPQIQQVHKILQPPNLDFFVVVTKQDVPTIQYINKVTYELLDQFKPTLDQVPFFRFGGSSNSGMYFHKWDGVFSNLYYWDYQLNELQILYNSNADHLYVEVVIENNEYFVIQSYNDIAIIDKSNNSINRILNVRSRNANLENIKFVTINGEERLLIADLEGYKYYRISADLELVEPIKLRLEEGIGEDVVKKDNIYLLWDKALGHNEVEYLFGDPLELKSFVASGELISDVFVAENKIYYSTKVNNINSLWLFDPELDQSILLKGEIIDYLGIKKIGNFLRYSTSEAYDIINDQILDINLDVPHWQSNPDLITDRYIYFNSSSRIRRMLVNDIYSLEQVYLGGTSILTTLENNTLVLGTDDGVLIEEEESDSQIIPYPNGFTKESLKAKDNLIILTDYDDEENRTSGFFLNLNDYTWKSFSFSNPFYDIVDNVIIGVLRELDTYEFSIYNTLTEDYKDTFLPSFPTILGSSEDKLYVHVYNENNIRVYNFNLQLQNEIQLQQLDGTLVLHSSDDYNYILFSDAFWLLDKEYNLGSYYVLNTELGEVITFNNCFGDVQLVDWVSFNETVEFIGYTESSGNQLYTYHLENFHSTDVEENNITQTLEVTTRPNPTNGILILDKILDELKVISIDGKIMIKAKNSDTIDLSTLKKGIYILHGTVDFKLISQKIIRG